MAVIPLGYRFEPTDEEMITYLRECIQNLPPNEHRQPITKAEIYEENPETLTHNSPSVENATLNRVWYLFGSRKRRCRKAENGYWKITLKEKSIQLNGAGPVLGFKAVLKYYVGGNPREGIPTNWLMNEYRLDEQGEANVASNRVQVLCRLYRKNGAVNNVVLAPQEVVLPADLNVPQDNEAMEVEENNQVDADLHGN